MKHLTIRSLAAAAVTGGLVLGSAGIAQADDSRSSDASSQSESSTELGAPIQFGGVTITNDSSSSEASNGTVTDGDESASESSSHSTEGAQKLHFGEFRIDPSFLQKAADAQRESARSTDGDGNRPDSTQREQRSESAQRTEAKAPAQVGPTQSQTERHEKSSSATTSRDGDESATQRTESESHDQQGIDLGGIKLNPNLGSESGEKESLVDSILN